MSNLPAGAEHDSNAPFNEEENFECNVCGAIMESDIGVCSSECQKVDML